MSNFKVGQRVVCVATGDYWIDDRDNLPCAGPKYNESIIIDFIKEGYLGFNKYDTEEGFEPESFRPLNFAEETEAMVQKFATGIEEYLEIIKETETIKIK